MIERRPRPSQGATTRVLGLQARHFGELESGTRGSKPTTNAVDLLPSTVPRLRAERRPETPSTNSTTPSGRRRRDCCPDLGKTTYELSERPQAGLSVRRVAKQKGSKWFTLGVVPVPDELAKRLSRAARLSTKWRAERDRLIIAAHDAGGGVREIARLAGVSHPTVIEIVRGARQDEPPARARDSAEASQRQ
jgi:hypothetical protein